MRKAPSILMLGVAVPALSALPVLTPPAPTPHSVAPEVHAVALAGVDEAALQRCRQGEQGGVRRSPV